MDSQKFGTFIAQCRKDKKMTQADLAAKLNVTDKAISRWERGAGNLLAAKRRDPVGDRFPGQPGGPSDGCRLAGEQGAGPAVCDPGRGVRLNRK